MMFVLDIETLDKYDSSVILSIAMVPFDPTKEFTAEELRKAAFFAKLNAAEQAKRGRTISKSTLEFWAKQSDFVKDVSFKPKPTDLPLPEAFSKLREWYLANKGPNTNVIFTRGGLDYSALEHAAEMYGIELPFKYWDIRDVRTAVDLLSGSTRGYCETTVSLEGLEKHHPVDDCVIDALMMKYYKEAV